MYRIVRYRARYEPVGGLGVVFEADTGPVCAWITRTYGRHGPPVCGAVVVVSDPSHPRLAGVVHWSGWTRRDSSPGHPPCKGGTLPLSYEPPSGVCGVVWCGVRTVCGVVWCVYSVPRWVLGARTGTVVWWAVGPWCIEWCDSRVVWRVGGGGPG